MQKHVLQTGNLCGQRGKILQSFILKYKGLLKTAAQFRIKCRMFPGPGVCLWKHGEGLEDLQLLGTCEVAEGTTLARLELQVKQGTFRGVMGVGHGLVCLCTCVYVYFLWFTWTRHSLLCSPPMLPVEEMAHKQTQCLPCAQIVP